MAAEAGASLDAGQARGGMGFVDAHRIEVDAERVLQLDQRFQEVSGTLGGAALSDVALRGTRLRFTVAGRTYEGEIDGAAMRGEGWTARRVE